jgi:hypothetical protein
MAKQRDVSAGPDPDTQTAPESAVDPVDPLLGIPHPKEFRVAEEATRNAAQFEKALKILTTPTHRTVLRSGRFSGHFPEELPDSYLDQCVKSLTSSGSPFNEKEAKAITAEFERRRSKK